MSNEVLAELKAELLKIDTERPADEGVRTLVVLIKFLMKTGLHGNETGPVGRLMTALSDHQHGKHNPMLAVNPLAGNRPHQADVHFQFFVAVTFALLQRSGSSKKQAASAIAARLKDLGMMFQPAQIEGWHREISSNRRRDPKLFQTYETVVKTYSEKSDIKKVALGFLDYLSQLERQQL